jgi:membrane fusion protein (multidrug efflux system)
VDGSPHLEDLQALEPAAPPRGLLQRVLRPLIAVMVVGAVVGGVVLYFHAQRYPSTEDAYIQADVVRIAPQVTGVVQKVYVVNNQHVDAGEPLFDIDPAPFQIAVDSAQATLDETTESVGASVAGVNAAAAHVHEADAALAVAQNDAERAHALRAAGNISDSTLDARMAALKQAQAGVAAANAELQRAQRQSGASGTDNARWRAADAALRKAKLDLSYTHVVAPNSGWVSNVTLREGASVTSGTPVFSLVEDNGWWVDAHFKETDIAHLRAGQPGEITVDMYPGRTFKGVVESISAGSGATFSMLPAENATGNWVKVTQRYTVRVRGLDRAINGDEPLRVGASAQVVVDTAK